MERQEEEHIVVPERLNFEDDLDQGKESVHEMLNFDDLDDKHYDDDVIILRQAIQSGDIAKVESLVGEGVGINWIDDDGLSAIIHGLETGNVKMVEALVRLGADIKYSDKDYGWTVLIYAIRQNASISMIEALVRLGADVNARDTEFGKTVLIHAVECHSVETVETLIRLGADVNAWDNRSLTPLTVCLIEIYDRKDKIIDNIPMLNVLIKLGANVNAQADDSGMTVLMEAFGSTDNVDQVVMLLQAGADKTINAQTKQGKTALIRFVTSNFDLHVDEYLFMINLLVEHGADINIQDMDGNTALMLALIENNLEAVEALLQKGADITIRNKEGNNFQDIQNRLNGTNMFIGQLEGYGDRDAPYQIRLSSKFVAYTQYRPIKPEDSEELRNILESVPKPHIVYSCPVGHLHWSEACGVPTQVDRCGRDTTSGPCKMLVGGVQHFLCPGCFVVYHDGYIVSKIWFGDFPAYSYPKYLQLVEQYNMAVEWSKKEMPDLNLQYMVPGEEKIPEDVALKINNLKDYEEVIVKQGGCSICSSGLDETDSYYLLNCGHLLCEDCLRSARQGDLTNINVGTEEDFAMRKCGIAGCGKRFHFGDPLQKIKLYKFAKHKKSSCIIS